MADFDLARVKRNVAKMAAQKAPEADIDGYIASEGTTVDAVRTFRPSSQPAQADQPTYGGMGMNTTAGLNDVLFGLAGAPVDLTRKAVNLGIRGINAVTGSEMEQLPEDYGLGSRKIGQMAGAVHPAMDPGNTVMNSPEERIARMAGQGVAGTVLPAGAVGGLSRAGAMSPGAGQMASRALGNASSVGEVGMLATVGGASGAGAGIGIENAPEGYEGLAALGGGLVGGGVGSLAAGTPALLREGARQIGRFAEPITPGGQRQMAARQLNEAATAPQAAIDTIETAPRELVRGSMPTTGQVTGDMGLLAAERASQTRFPEQFQQRRADQNTARVQALEPIGGAGAPEKVAQSLRSRLQQIDDETQAALGEATRLARTRAAEVGPAVRPDEAGSVMRGSLEAARAMAKEQEGRLWRAVDPDNTLSLRAGSLRQEVTGILKDLPASAKPPSGEERGILEIARTYGDVVPFSEITALQSRVKAALREERMTSGESPAYRRLSQLNGALMRDLESAVAGKVEQEAQAVAAGRMSFEDTIAAKLQGERENWLGGRQALAGNQGGGPRPVGYAAGGSPAIPGVRGAAGEVARGSGPAASNSRLAGGEPNFDQAALDRLNLATEATRGRLENFDNKAFGPIRKRPSTNSPYDMPAAAVPGRIFFPQPKSAEVVERFRQAVGDDQAMEALQGYAVDNLRRTALRDDFTFDPDKLARWRDQHKDALRSFPALNRKLGDAKLASETMAEVEASRRVSLDAAQKGTVGRLLGVEDPADVTRIIGGLFARQDAVQQMTTLRQVVGDNPEAVEGLRKAAADFIGGRLIGNTEAGTSGQAAIRSDQMQTFVRQNRPALRQVFSDDEIGTMEAIAADLQRSNRSLNAVRIPGQSNTAQDTLAAGDSTASMLTRIVGTLAVAGGGAGIATNSITGMSIAGGTIFASALRERGIRSVDELVRDALLNPDLAKVLMQSVKPGQEAQAAKTLAKALRSSTLATSGIAGEEASGTDQNGQLRIDVRPQRQDPLQDPAMGPRSSLQPQLTEKDHIIRSLLGGEPQGGASPDKQRLAAMLMGGASNPQRQPTRVGINPMRLAEALLS